MLIDALAFQQKLKSKPARYRHDPIKTRQPSSSTERDLRGLERKGHDCVAISKLMLERDLLLLLQLSATMMRRYLMHRTKSGKAGRVNHGLTRENSLRYYSSPLSYTGVGFRLSPKEGGDGIFFDNPKQVRLRNQIHCSLPHESFGMLCSRPSIDGDIGANMEA